MIGRSNCFAVGFSTENITENPSILYYATNQIVCSVKDHFYLTIFLWVNLSKYIVNRGY